MHSFKISCTNTLEIDIDNIKIANDDNKIYCLSGEVYNINKFDIPELYAKYKDNFVNFIDGDFLIIIIDLFLQRIDFYTDIWGATQVCCVETSNNSFIFSDCPVDRKTSQRLGGNSHYNFDIVNKQFRLITNQVYKLDYTQYKTNYIDWVSAFEDAVVKRYSADLALALSSGLDSGAIALCLASKKLPFYALHLQLRDVEDYNTFQKICDFSKSYMQLKIVTAKEKDQNLFNLIAKEISTQNKLLLVTGNGADGVIDHYMSKYQAGIPAARDCNFKEWPEDFNTVADLYFDNSHMHETYNQNFENIKFNIRCRNVYYDKRLTQEWLWIDSKLKNIETKGPLKHYFREKGIPIPCKAAGLYSQIYNIDYAAKDPKLWKIRNN